MTPAEVSLLLLYGCVYVGLFSFSLFFIRFLFHTNATVKSVEKFLLPEPSCRAFSVSDRAETSECSTGNYREERSMKSLR